MNWRTAAALSVFALICGAATACAGTGTSPTPSSAVGTTTPAIASCAKPGGTGCPPLSNTRGASITVIASDNGAPIPWTYVLAGLTVSGNGDNVTGFSGLTPGDLEVTGQMTSRGSFRFFVDRAGSNLPGGIVANSLQSLEGPGASASCGSVSYFIGTGVTTPQSFRFKFTLDLTSTSPGC
jgi:hypothetical protein